MRLAFQQHSASEVWAGGITFLENLFLALRTLGPDCPTLVLVVDEDMPGPDYQALAARADEVLRTPMRLPSQDQLKLWSPRYHVAWWLRTRLLKAPEPAPRHPLTEILPKHHIDGFFSMAVTPTALSSVPTVIWLPDFQFRRLPDSFSPEDRLERERVYAAQARAATRVLVTADEVRQDLQAFAPAQASKTRLIAYVADVPTEIYEQDPRQCLASYHLPEKFIYLPNQFWQHKNHKRVFEALGQLAVRGVRPRVVTTGSPFEYRRPALFAELMQLLSRLNIREQVIILGQVPRADVFRLMRQSVCVLNASTFEGLGLSVAESKSLGKRVLVSDLSPLREQNAPGAVYFDPNNVDELASKLEQVWGTTAPGPDFQMEAAARAELPGRQAAFGRALLQVFQEAQADFNSSRVPERRPA